MVAVWFYTDRVISHQFFVLIERCELFGRYSSDHPSSYCFVPQAVLFTMLAGAFLNFLQHFSERGAQPAFHLELLPYSRMERKMAKTLCGFVAMLIPALIAFAGGLAVVAQNADLIETINATAQDPQLYETYRSTLLPSRLAIHYLHLFSGCIIGYAALDLANQVFGHWWRTLLFAAYVWAVLYFSNAVWGIYFRHARYAVSATGDMQHSLYMIRFTEYLLPSLGAIAIAIACLVASFRLERHRALENTGRAMYWPKLRLPIIAVACLGSLMVWVVSFISHPIGLWLASLLLILAALDAPRALLRKR